MKFALALALIVPTSVAFMAPSAQVSSSLKASPYENEIGVLPPTGYFDPAKLCNSNTDPETFARYREAELKHGRVCQLVVLGYVVPEFYRFPGEVAKGLPFADVPNGLAALKVVPFWGWLQIIIAIGAVDKKGFLGDFDIGKRDESDLPGDLLEKRLTQELQHGRLAMLATLELFRHDAQNLVVPNFDGLPELITGLPFIYKDFDGGEFFEKFSGIGASSL
uniref:Plastid light harvesting protein n=1 Tax=Aureoumbra lagunensis TaxID=44058 RepID=A0A7S3NI94_9STRA|mmetsp:Transcript_13930/g.18589  ORF Transcript_13930/g.18589 Transcript_13930/m.18589 type:complete len:221 (-) Transcript_13930:246-908(-)|eukprot:CAMPEP_0197298486 /NCGR_PEP_ID=MMETSP0890-20130614/43653_1 /TAXON_ID=44058 ORGANISM="Aureoumbra lagunensis, Strain CCMP1510" /NCGR_SAMPLE_ID=MMETSP0890 /ASSEMBLY_ACC=CAM_ASM_000533 /LENGTH=220 /DNA_ID=CAMNT_0042776283 /DNA_START=17 /DNA_END=679 /DNA_ORIENTATION=-